MHYLELVRPISGWFWVIEGGEFRIIDWIHQKMSSIEDTKKQTPTEVDDDQPDEWDKRINKTGCSEENLKLTLCHADTGDWRQCTKEMAAFKNCWAQNQNNLRTSTVNNEEK